jgi:hypothetical protein
MKRNLLLIKLLAFRKKTTILTFALFFGLFISSVTRISGQEIMQLDALLASFNLNTEEGRYEKATFEKMFYGLNPMLFLTEGTVKQYGESLPILVCSDVSSLELLYKENPLFSKAAIIRINIDKQTDLSAMLDLDKLSSYVNLKYIVFRSSFEICAGKTNKGSCELGKISAMLHSSSGNNFKILYQVSVPE